MLVIGNGKGHLWVAKGNCTWGSSNAAGQDIEQKARAAVESMVTEMGMCA